MEQNFLSVIPFEDITLFEFNHPTLELAQVMPFLRQVNCFAGANNSGKSRLIRQLYHLLQEKSGFTNHLSLHKRKPKLSEFESIYYLSQRKIEPFKEFIEILNAFIEAGSYEMAPKKELLYHYYNHLPKHIHTLDAGKLQELFEQTNFAYYNYDSLYEYTKREIRSITELLDKTLKEVKPIFDNKLYIPILRGMRPLDAKATDYYAERTEKDYGIVQNNIFTGLSLYKELQEYLLGDYEKRNLVREFEQFVSKSFFKGVEVSLIPRINQDVVYVRVGAKEHPIYELGDGVQALIILTFPLFLRKNERYAIFIEEPEAHLHPTWQRFFMDTIYKHFGKHQFFLTTHSNVFLNYENNNIYHVKQNATLDKSIIRHLDKQKSEILEDLGYKASDVLNANYILWVEGISDVIYLKQFIKAYDDTLVEGVHYTIMMYGGCSHLTHFVVEGADEHKIKINAINSYFGFCIDSDRKVDKGFLPEIAKQNFVTACKLAEKFCWMTDVREIENLIPPDTWKAAAIQYAKHISQCKDTILDDKAVQYSYDWNYGDRMKTKVDNGKCQVNINDKIKMAKAVVEIFPKDKTDLQKMPELFQNIEKLVKDINTVNQV